MYLLSCNTFINIFGCGYCGTTTAALQCRYLLNVELEHPAFVKVSGL